MSKLELVRVDYQYLPLILQQRSVSALQVVLDPEELFPDIASLIYLHNPHE